MKKIRNLLIIVLSFVLFSVPVFASFDAPNGTTYSYCYKVSDYGRAGQTGYYYSDSPISFEIVDTTLYRISSAPGYYVYYMSDGSIDFSGTFAAGRDPVIVIESGYDIEIDDNPFDGDEVPPLVAPIVVDWTEFTSLIVRNLGNLAIVGCLVLSLMLSPILVKKLYRLVRP